MKPGTLAGWGRLSRPGSETLTTDLESATRRAVLCRGLGRSQGDASLPARPEDRIIGTSLAKRVLAFDDQTGILRAEAGFSIADLNRLFVPRGWFSPVTPGTKFVTLGGMVSCDVHGKNHHRDGCFGAHVRALRVRLANDDLVECSPEEHADLFFAVIGGLGLLGHVLEVEVTLRRIPSAWVVTHSERIPNIDAFVAALARAAPEWPMTMGWVDALSRGDRLGRGIMIASRWATLEETASRTLPRTRAYSLPFELPTWVLNPLFTRALNSTYYRRHSGGPETAIVTAEKYFYPLDSVLHWNRAYGARGFTQYQCVLPRRGGPEAVRALLQQVSALGLAPPLCGIKDYGPEGRGLLSFPMEGTSVAMDLPVSPDTQRSVERLNEFVIEAGGRVYLGKDSFTRPAQFRAMEPRLPRFLEAREKWDPQRRLRSALSVRLFGDRAS